jgi:hypothetical protein
LLTLWSRLLELEELLLSTADGSRLTEDRNASGRPGVDDRILLVFIFLNEFMLALTFEPGVLPHGDCWGGDMSGAFAYEIPGLWRRIVTSTALDCRGGLFQRRIVAGLTAGGVKQ